MNFRELIRAELKQKKMSVNSLVELVEWSGVRTGRPKGRQKYFDYLNGKSSISADTLERIFDALKLTEVINEQNSKYFRHLRTEDLPRLEEAKQRMYQEGADRRVKGSYRQPKAVSDDGTPKLPQRAFMKAFATAKLRRASEGQ